MLAHRGWQEECLRVIETSQSLQRTFQPRDFVRIEIDKDNPLASHRTRPTAATAASFTADVHAQAA